jgi:hypothetical protein
MKEISHILRRQDLVEQHNIILAHPQIMKIMGTLLTTDFVTEGSEQQLTMDQLIEIIKQTAFALSNMVFESHFCDGFYAQYNILNILKSLLVRYFLDEDRLQVKACVQSKNTPELLKRVSCLEEMLHLSANFIAHQANIYD